MWFLGGRLGPRPLSHTSRPPWIHYSGYRPEKLIQSLLPKLRTSIFLGSSVFTSIFPLIILFYRLTFIQLLLSVVQTFCTSSIVFGLCKVPLQYVIGIPPLKLRLQIWPPPFQIREDFGSVITARHVDLQSRIITILYALNAESRYVTCKLFVNNATTGLLRNARCSLAITISYV